MNVIVILLRRKKKTKEGVVAAKIHAGRLYSSMH